MLWRKVTGGRLAPALSNVGEAPILTLPLLSLSLRIGLPDLLSLLMTFL